MVQELDIVFLPLVSIVFLIGVGFILWIIALISFLGTENMEDDRIVWAIIIVFTGPIGAILWFVMGRPKFQK